MTRYVVLDGHTLGYIIGKDIQVLRASVIRGGSHVDGIGITPIPMNPSRIRPATLEDFADFRVQVPPGFGEGYGSPEDAQAAANIYDHLRDGTHYQRQIDAMRAMGMERGAARQVADLYRQGIIVY